MRAFAPPVALAAVVLLGACTPTAPSSGGGDARSAPDAAAVLEDASSDAAPSPTGLAWPNGRSFPSFAPVRALDVADLTKASVDERLVLVTLQGVVNRREPRVYLTAADPEGATFWLDDLAVEKHPVPDPMALVVKYAAEIRGVVVYDSALRDTVNLATTIAGVEGAVVASPTLAAVLNAPPYALATIVDLRANHFASPLDVYRYELATYGAKTTHRLLVGLDPKIGDALRDYAIATQAMVVWLDPRKAADHALLDEVLSRLDSCAPYVGWWPDELTGVRASARVGIPTYAADWARNLTVLGASSPSPSPSASPSPSPIPSPSPHPKAFIALFMSDGDNLQEDQHLLPQKWSDPNRGSVPIAWSVQPALVDVAPVILDHFRRTATPNDILVSGPSGLGYTYPREWPAARLDDYLRGTADALDRAHLDVIAIWNDGQPLSGDTAKAYASNLPHLLGVTDQLATGRLTILDGRLPHLDYVVPYAETERDLVRAIDAKLATWTRKAPLFLAAQGDMNSHAITPSTFLAVARRYAARGDVVFVRADQLFMLIREASSLPTRP